MALTGWAMHPGTSHRLGVDLALPLSDHADYDELFDVVRRIDPRVVYCTHGPRAFVDHLRQTGVDARPLVGDAQLRLFA